MAKSRKGFAQANGRKKARLARADTKRKKIAIKKSERISVVKVAADEEAREREEQKAEGTREGDDADWTDIGSVTTGGGLRMTPVQREKARLLTRKQAARKTKLKDKGTAYKQRLLRDAKVSMARKIHKKMEGKEYRKELDAQKATREEY